ncbi:DUF2480 family protein [Eudoraea sp.]|uniref:DUF2480 family protein n=1 Tax=Eudoraea sp. TaxID=1979955 RepID=UPI003C75D1FC
MSEIVNRVAKSSLVTFDLEDYYLEGRRYSLDIKDWLFEGFILREKEFREHLELHNWDQYKDAYVALNCSTDAIIPGWAYMLVATKLEPIAKSVVIGSLEMLETTIFQSVIEDMDLTPFKDKAVIIKGCTNKPIPPNAYLWITLRLQGVSKSLMYGEACSSVPLVKRKKI